MSADGVQEWVDGAFEPPPSHVGKATLITLAICAAFLLGMFAGLATYDHVPKGCKVYPTYDGMAGITCTPR